MKYLLVVVAALLGMASSHILAQCILPVRWAQSIYGGSQDCASDITPTFDGGYVAVGWTTSPPGAGGTDLIVTKYTFDGGVMWSHTYGGTGDDYGNGIVETEDHGLICAGSFTNAAGNTDVLLLKYSETGVLQWSRTYGGAGNDGANKIIQMTDEYFCVVGSTNSSSSNYNFYILSVDANGDTLWTRQLGSTYDDFANSACVADSGVVIVGAGNQWYHSNPQAYGMESYGMVTKLNYSGEVLWTRYIDFIPDETGTHNSQFLGISRTHDGGFILAGGAESWRPTGMSIAHFPRVLLTQIDGTGNLLRQRNWALVNPFETCGLYCNATRAYQLQDRSFAVTGYGNDGCHMYGYVARVDSLLNLLSACRYGGPSSTSLIGHDGGMVLGGASNTDNYGGTHSLVYACETDTALQVLVVRHPNGGERLQLLDSAVVQWTDREYASLKVKIELNRNYPAGSWEVLADSTMNDGEETFVMSGSVAEHCRVRISTLTWPWYWDVSDSNFVITTTTGYLAVVDSTQPQIAIMSWNAGTHECPEGLSMSYRFKNFGSQNLVAFSPSILNGTDFTISHNCPAFFALAPGEMGAYNIGLSYAPQSEGTQRDTVRMMSNAANAIDGYIRIPLSGSQIRTPASPQIVIQTQGQDAQLTWQRITTSTGGCPIAVTEYLVFYADNSTGPYLYHGHTTDSSYVHSGVVRHAPAMYYHVYASTAPLLLLLDLPPSGQNPPMSEEQVLEMLRQSGAAYERVSR